MQYRIRRAVTRRAVAVSASGALVAGALATAVVGAAAPAGAAPVEITHQFDTVCDVQVDDLAIPNQKIKANLKTTVDLPLVPGSTQPEQDVSVTLTMPKTLQKATKILKVTHAKGHSRDSAVDITLPVPEALGGKVTNRVPLVGLSAPKSKVPGVKKAWKITSTGTVPEVDVPGFAGDGNATPPPTSFAAFKLAPKFTINAKLIAKKKTYKSTMTCTVKKADRLITDEAPILGAYKADTVDGIHKGVGFEQPAQVQLVFFNPTGDTSENSWTEPEHGTLTPGAQGLFTYTPEKGYAGPDSFDYTAKDSTGESTSTVTLKVKKAKSSLAYKAPRKVRFGKVAKVRVKVTSEGKRRGPISLTKGSRVLDEGMISDGRAMLRIERKALKVGKHTLKIRYAGSDTVRPANAKLTLRVLKRR